MTVYVILDPSTGYFWGRSKQMGAGWSREPRDFVMGASREQAESIAERAGLTGYRIVEAVVERLEDGPRPIVED